MINFKKPNLVNNGLLFGVESLHHFEFNLRDHVRLGITRDRHLNRVILVVVESVACGRRYALEQDELVLGARREGHVDVARLQVDGQVVTLVVVPEPEQAVGRFGLEANGHVQVGSIAAGEFYLRAVATHERVLVREIHARLAWTCRRCVLVRLVDVALSSEFTIHFAY